jgi:hypothetical protein
MAVTPTILKEHVETDLSTIALQRLIDAANNDITERYGSFSEVTEEYDMTVDRWEIRRDRIWTRQQIKSVTLLEEGFTLKTTDLVALVLDTDFFVVFEGQAVERIDTMFRRRVRITYVPQVANESQRDRVIIDLCKLMLQWNGLQNERIGDWSGQVGDYETQRRKILSTLSIGRRFYA